MKLAASGLGGELGFNFRHFLLVGSLPQGRHRKHQDCQRATLERDSGWLRKDTLLLALGDDVDPGFGQNHHCAAGCEHYNPGETNGKEFPVAGERPFIDANEQVCFLDAVELAKLIRRKELSAREVMRAHRQRIERLNPRLNAIVTLLPEDELMAQAEAADQAVIRGEALGPLHGIPVAVKDSYPTQGIRTTSGSLLFKDYVPDFDCLVVEREKKAGAIVIGKTNLPEFGLGSQTFNKVFGATLNPYDVTKTCGGSSGGGAVALACGMVPLADGSDMGGSLRNPPNFCNVVGMRTSPGRVPNSPVQLGWFTQGVAGPMARSVADCALFLSALAGFDRRSPMAIDSGGEQFAAALDGRKFTGVRVAMMKDLGLPWEPVVKQAVAAQGKVFESLGCIVEEAEADLRDANECFVSWRHWMLELQFGEMVQARGEHLNQYIHWHVEEGRKLTGPYLARVEAKRTALYQRMRKFMETYEFFVLPVNQVLPFEVGMPYPREIDGTAMENYLAWMKSAYYISAVGNPAISVPCAFSENGLPIGIQIVGRHNDDWGVLQMAYAFEQATRIGRRRPVMR
jgi:amidase